ncbi:hypothetical protein N2152v2_008509 [Parachlorella kessleri]
MVPVLFGLVIAYGCLGAAAAQETVTGKLSISIQGHDGWLNALVLQDSPRTVFNITNWQQLLRQGLPSDVRSGAVVTVTGFRVSHDASKTTAVQLTATKVALVKLAPPAKLLSVSAAGGVRPQILPKADMTVLIIRPRLPSTCVAPGNSAVGSGNATAWPPVIAEVNALQKACTGGRLTYQPPVVTPYIDIPCTPMPAGNRCDGAAYWQWVADARSLLPKYNYDENKFDHLVVDLPIMQDCNGVAGQGEMGGKLMVVMQLIWSGGAAHEFGHNYMLSHSSKLLLAPSDPLPANMPVNNPLDDSNLMGYASGVRTCFSLPMSTSIGLTGVRKFLPSQLSPGKWVATQLKPSWAATPQGAVFTPANGAQANWAVWASYIVSTGSPYKTLLTTPQYNKAVLIHLTNPQWLNFGAPAVYRIRAMQSGDIFRWTRTGLVFKFVSTTTDGQIANIQVCREVTGVTCKWVDSSTKVQAVGNKVRLMLPTMDSHSDWCLRGCSSGSCQLPRIGAGAYPPGLANAYFSRPCPADNSSQWQAIVHASGFQRWKNVATGKCLSLRQAYAYNYAAPKGEFYLMKYRMALDSCNTAAPPDERQNPQLFLPQQVDAGPLTAYSSSLLYPNCDGCGVDNSICLEACPDVTAQGLPQPYCAKDIPASSSTTQNTIAVAGYCWLQNHQRLKVVSAK